MFGSLFKEGVCVDNNLEDDKIKKLQNYFLSKRDRYNEYLHIMGIQKEYDNAYQLLKLLGGEVEPDPNNPFLIQHVASLKMQDKSLTYANYLIELRKIAYNHFAEYDDKLNTYLNMPFTMDDAYKKTEAALKPLIQSDIEILKKQSPLRFFSM